MAGKEEDSNNHFSGYVCISFLDFVLCSSFCQLLFIVPPVSLRALFDLCQLRIFATAEVVFLVRSFHICRVFYKPMA